MTNPAAATPESIRRMLSVYRRWVIPISMHEMLLELGELKASLEQTRLECVAAGWLQSRVDGKPGYELTEEGHRVAWQDYLEGIARRAQQEILSTWWGGTLMARHGREAVA